MKKSLSRRAFVGMTSGMALAGVAGLAGCVQLRNSAKLSDDRDNAAPFETDGQGLIQDGNTNEKDMLVYAYKPLPKSIPSPDPDNTFGVDSTITMDTIDEWLNRPDVVYRDMRLVKDPADYAAIGGSPTLDFILEGFRVTPFPYIARLPALPVDNAYSGDTLFDVEWADDMTIVSVVPNYEQSMAIIEDLFPKDMAIFLMCGGAGYAGQMKTLLTYLGWDPAYLYNIGGAWDYTGYHSIQIVDMHSDLDDLEYFLWRLDMVDFDFAQYRLLR